MRGKREIRFAPHSFFPFTQHVYSPDGFYVTKPINNKQAKHSIGLVYYYKSFILPTIPFWTIPSA